jgi:chromosome segregation ATPase
MMQDQAEEMENQLRTLTNRKMDLDSQLNDAQAAIRKIMREKDASELDVRAKRKEIERIKVELNEMELAGKRRDQKLFEYEEQFKTAKKQLNQVAFEMKELKAKLREHI